jgi:ABC-type multidrug transport system permease subunit
LIDGTVFWVIFVYVMKVQRSGVAEAAVVARLLSFPLNPLFLLSLSALPVLGDNFFFVSLIPL